MIKIIHRYLRGRWERYYFKSHWHFILDFTLLSLIVVLAASLVSLYFYKPNLPGLGPYYPHSVNLNNPPLDLQFKSEAKSFRINEGIDLKIIYNNKATTAVKNLAIDFTPLADNFYVAKVETESESAAVIQGQTLIINQIPAGASGEVDIKISFNSKNPDLRQLTWRTKSSYSLAGQILTATYNLPLVTVAAELYVQSYAYYTSPQGDQLGTGPIPPIVGLPTNYWIFWEARSRDNFNNLVLSARLPQGVELSKRQSLLAGDFNYNADARQLIWKIPMLKGQDDDYRLGFEVQLIPTVAQTDKILNLINDFRYSAQDTATEEIITGTLGSLTTNLSDDHFNSGRGKVLAQ